MHIPKKNRVKAFTLIEMLLVVFLIGLVASSMILVVDNKDDQNRHDETILRYKNIRDAIIGSHHINLNGSPQINGFIADMGRLPANLDELITLSDPELITPQTIGNGKIQGALLSHGWCGPYLSIFNQQFTDGWGGGFVYDSDSGLELQSLGKDRLAGRISTENSDPNNYFYEADFPAEAELTSNLYEISSGHVRLNFVSDGINIDATHLIIGILYPGLDTSEEIGGGSLDYHSSIVLAGVDNKTPFEINGIEEKTLLLQNILPNKYIRKFQVVVYYKGDGSTPALPSANGALEDSEVEVDQRVFQLVPQTDTLCEVTINI